MRKIYKEKRHSCALCKPQKMGHAPRWNNKELEALKRWERERLEDDDSASQDIVDYGINTSENPEDQ
jgi:hypothetical protein